MQSISKKEIIDATKESLRQPVARIVGQIFDSMSWQHVSAAGRIEETTWLEAWSHRSPREIEADLAYLQINRQGVRAALHEYLANASLATKQLDWLFLNVLTYAEYLGTVNEVRKGLMGVERYVKSLHPPKAEHTVDVSAFASRLWHIPVALTLVGVSAAIHPALGGVAAIGAVLAKLNRKKAFKQINGLLLSMLQAYSSFNTPDLGWAHVASSLVKAKEAGAIWDASVFALVEQRGRQEARG